MWIGFSIWSAVTVIFLVLAARSFRSEEAAGFFAGVTPPKVTDIRRYNRAVGRIWLVYGVMYELLGVPILFMEQNSPWFLVIILGAVFWTIALVVTYVITENKYRTR